MLIKRKKLTHLQVAHGISVPELNETTKAAQQEIQKAKQEARTIKQEAQEILAESQKKLKEAEIKAKEIVQNTILEANKLKEKVYLETMEAANEEAEFIKSQAKELLKELFEVKRSALIQAHNEIIKVALDLAEKIIKYKVSVDPDILKTQVTEAIKKATSEAERVKVFVNPVDLKTLEENLSDIEKLFPSGLDIVLLTSDTVDPGSCIIETKSGQLDASFSAQITTLTKLVSHLEVQEPKIELKTEEEQPQLIKGEKKEELLGSEPLINFPQEELVFPFEEEQKQDKEEIPETPELITETTDQVSEDKIAKTEIQESPELEDEIIEVPEQTVQSTGSKKRLALDESLIERTKEEAEELDEMDFDFDEEDEEEEKKIQPFKNILKPKGSRTQSSEISEIAQEVEQSQEWKDLVQDEEE